ncbi:MAG: hypothetical protein LLG16_04335 [Euryarchaeota archaeon]|nr:hypothetical protein [Euryarchaeota archaeon]
MPKKIECIDCGPGVNIESLANRLVVKDKIAIIPGLEEVFADVIKLRLDTRAMIGDELIRRVKLEHIIPPEEERDYREALLDEYDRRTIDFV